MKAPRLVPTGQDQNCTTTNIRKMFEEDFQAFYNEQKYTPPHIQYKKWPNKTEQAMTIFFTCRSVSKTWKNCVH